MNLMLMPSKWEQSSKLDSAAQYGVVLSALVRLVRRSCRGKNRVVQKAIRQSAVCVRPRIHASMVEYQAIPAFLGKANRTLL